MSTTATTSEKPESIRHAFAERFGEDQTQAIEAAAISHGNGVNDQNKGSDPFKWALLICIGYECFEKPNYRDYHGITAPFEDIKTWCIGHADFANHDGDFDYLADFAGSYSKYMPEQSERLKVRRAIRAANIKRLAERMAEWAERPGDEWCELRATDAACRVFADADDLHTLLSDLMHDMGMDEEGFPLTDEGDRNWSADRLYTPVREEIHG